MNNVRSVRIICEQNVTRSGVLIYRTVSVVSRGSGLFVSSGRGQVYGTIFIFSVKIVRVEYDMLYL